MLHRLTVHNYVLIDELDIDFSKGLTIVTGETGAGKSILLGALALILGERADSGVLLDKKKKCIIEGVFDIGNYNLNPFFETHELDYSNETCLRREINAEGKSRAFINDTPVNLSQLKQLGASLVDIHSQHETLTLSNSSFQLGVVDAFAKHHHLLTKYHALFISYSHHKKELAELKEKEKQSKLDLDYLQFQFDELEEAKLETSEQQKLEAELSLLTNAGEIQTNLSNATSTLMEGESNLVDQLASVLNVVSQLVKFDKQFDEIAQRLKSSVVELKDIADEIAFANQKLESNPQRAEIINERLNIIYRLQQKHHVNSVEELITIKEEVSNKLAGIGSLEDTIVKLEKELNEITSQLFKTAESISTNRAKAIPKIENSIKEMLSNLAMPNAVLKIQQDILDKENFNSSGIDKISFLFSANKGVTYKELNKVASGGELSRLMLSIKSLIAQLTALPTIVFDEIDTGISGETASKMGVMMQKISSDHQVIAITHLPQIASKGNVHYVVFKEETGKTVRTGINKLDKQERVKEIARMLSGEKLTDAAMENAKELLSL